MKQIICQSAPRAETHSKAAGSHMKSTTRTGAQVVLWAILALALTLGGTASALNLNLSYEPDATFLAAGLTAGDIVDMKAANTYAALQFTSRYTDPVDVNIHITAVPGTGTLGMSSTFLALVPSYAALRAAMVTDSTTPDDATVLAAGGSLPAADPIGTTHTYLLARAEAKALGLAPNDLSNDGTFTFGGGFLYTYDPNNRAVAGRIDFIGVAMHEFSEIMGRIGLMGANLTGQPNYMLFDLFHYTGAGVRGLNNGAGRSFSINNGTTLLKAFNDAATNGGDLQDWASGANDCFNAFSSDSVRNDLTAVDLRNMDVIGYNFSTGGSVGPLCTEFYESFDRVTAPALPAGWMATNPQGPAPLWVTATTTPASPPNYAFVDDPGLVSDKVLDTPGIFISSASVRLFFSHSYNLERDTGNFYDGAVLEVSSPTINGGTFTDITDAAVGGSFVSGGYNATISNCCGNPLANRMAWGGDSGGYGSVVANPGPNVVGQTIKVRFRMASDSSVSATGWSIDGFAVQDFACPLQSAVSRKVHGAAGTFDINLPFDATSLIPAPGIGIECRSGGAYQVVFNFASAVSFTGASLTGTGSVSSSTGGGTATVAVNLTGVTDVQRIRVTLSGVNTGTRTGDIGVPMGVLIGDVSGTGNGTVNSTDVSATKAAVSAGVVNGSTFRADVNASGTLSSTDVATVKANVPHVLPP